jgi:cysteine desulfurase
VALIAGFALAVERAVASLEENARRLAQTRDAFEANLLARVERVCVNGCPSHRLPNTSNLSFLGTRTEALLIALDLAGVYASAGTACASGSLEPSPVLEAMHLDRDRIDSAVRFSFARTTDSGDVVRAADEIARNVERVRRAIS